MSVCAKIVFLMFGLAFSTTACFMNKAAGKQMQADIIALKTQFEAIRKIHDKEKVALRQRLESAEKRSRELSELIETYRRTTGRNVADFGVEIERLKRFVTQLRGQLEVNQHHLNSIEQDLSKLMPDLSAQEGPDHNNATLLAAGAGQTNGSKKRLLSIHRPESEADFYKLAHLLMKSKQYKAGRILFEEFLKKWSVGPYSDNALYWIAESYYQEGNYRKAALTFQMLREKFSKSDKLDDALYKVALCFYSMKMYRESLPFLKKFLNDYPKNRLTRVARKKMQEVERKMSTDSQGMRRASPGK